MRLSPVMVAAVAIASPLGSSLSANAQSTDSIKQTKDVVIPGTHQPSDPELVPVKTSKVTVVAPEIDAHPSTVIKVLTANSVTLAKSVVISPAKTKTETKVNSAALLKSDGILPAKVFSNQILTKSDGILPAKILPAKILPTIAQVPPSTPPNSTSPATPTNPTLQPVFPTTPENDITQYPLGNY